MNRVQCFVILISLGCSLTCCRSVAAEDAAPISSISVQNGFEVELLRSAQEGEDSWISMTFDDRGRILLGLDGKGDDQFDDVQLLKSFDYRSRYGHGANQLVLGPDNRITINKSHRHPWPRVE